MLFLCSPRICKDSRHKTGHNCCATIIDNIHENTQQHENNTVRQHKILHLHSRFPWHRKAASGKQDGQDDPGKASCTVSLALRPRLRDREPGRANKRAPALIVRESPSQRLPSALAAKVQARTGETQGRMPCRLTANEGKRPA